MQYYVESSNNYLVSTDSSKYINKFDISNKNISDTNRMLEIELSDTSILENKIVNPKFMQRASFVGLSASRFSRYSSGMWINKVANYPTSSGYPSGGIC